MTSSGNGAKPVQGGHASRRDFAYAQFWTTTAGKFLGRYDHRVITGGIGHDLPQEAPRAFAQAFLDVDLMSKE